MSVSASVRIRAVIRVLVGLVFVFAAILKMLAFHEFTREVQMTLPFTWGVGRLLLAVVLMEAALGAGLILRIRERACWLGVIGMLSVFSVWLGYGIVSGAFDSCGCFGDHFEMPLEWALVRNGVILWIAVYFYNKSE